MTRYNYVYIEDDPLSREVMEMLLVNVVGVKNLTIFQDSADMLARLRGLDYRPDFILLDIHVTPDDGYQVLRLLRADPDFQPVSVIAVTASVMTDEVKQLKTSGFDGALAKPLDMAVFPDLIARLEAGEAVWQVR